MFIILSKNIVFYIQGYNPELLLNLTLGVYNLYDIQHGKKF